MNYDPISDMDDLSTKCDMLLIIVTEHKEKLKALKYKLIKSQAPTSELQSRDYTLPRIQNNRRNRDADFNYLTKQIAELEEVLEIEETLLDLMYEQLDTLEKLDITNDKLVDLQTKIIYLKKIKKLTLKEVAQELNISYQYCKNLSSKYKLS